MWNISLQKLQINSSEFFLIHSNSYIACVFVWAGSSCCIESGSDKKNFQFTARGISPQKGAVSSRAPDLI